MVNKPKKKAAAASVANGGQPDTTYAVVDKTKKKLALPAVGAKPKPKKGKGKKDVAGSLNISLFFFFYLFFLSWIVNTAIQDSRLLDYLIREIKTWLNINSFIPENRYSG